MKDSFGRTIDYLRISLTDKCNLRCVYCMPPEGITHLNHEEILSFEEIIRVVTVMAGLGVKKIRLTGGEPLIRRGILELVQKLNKIEGIEEISLTTNGILLSEYASALKNAGISGVNVSLDTLNEDIFQKIANPPVNTKNFPSSTDFLSDEKKVPVNSEEHASVSAKKIVSLSPKNCPQYADCFSTQTKASVFSENSPSQKNLYSVKNILNGIDAALEVGLKVKINCVPCRSYNENNLEEIARLAKNLPIDVRFIEVMPVGRGKNFTAIPSEEILNRLEKSFGKAEKILQKSHAPATNFHFKDFSGNIGFISPLSHSFCSECNRVRLTTEGILKLCLCYSDGINLKKILRSGAGDDTLKNEIINAIQKKPRAHSFCRNSEADLNTTTENNKESHVMVQIGG